MADPDRPLAHQELAARDDLAVRDWAIYGMKVHHDTARSFADAIRRMKDNDPFYRPPLHDRDFDRCSDEYCRLARQLESIPVASEAPTAPVQPPAVLPSAPEPQDGAALIMAERQRQIGVEGWSAAHDDVQHEDGALASAALCYLKASWREKPSLRVPADWPWESKWWKPSPDPIRNLAKAGALIAAEMDRLMRSDPFPASREAEQTPPPEKP